MDVWTQHDWRSTWIWLLQRHLQMTLSSLSRAIDSASVQWNSLDVKKWALFTKVGYGVPVFPRPIYYCQQRWWNWHWCLEKMYAVWGYCSRSSRNCKRTNVHPFFIPLDSSSPFSFESPSSVGWGLTEDFVAAIVVVNVLRPTALLIPESTTKVGLHNNYF